MAALVNYRPSLTAQVFAGFPIILFIADQTSKYSEFASTAIHATFTLLTAERMLKTGYMHLQERGAWNKLKGAVQCFFGTTWIAELTIEAAQKAELLPSIGMLDEEISKLDTFSTCLQTNRDSAFYQDNICVPGHRNLAKMETKFGQEEQVMASCSKEGVSNSTIPASQEGLSILGKGVAACIQKYNPSILITTRTVSSNDLKPQINESLAR